MKLTLDRKQFLTSVVAGLAGSALPSVVLKAATASKTTVDKFTSLVGTSFQVQPSGREAVTLTLAAVDKRKPSNGTTQFSLQFVAPAGEELAEGTHDVEHATLGRFPMFLVPLPADAKGQTRFRADFNLLDAPAQKRR